MFKFIAVHVYIFSTKSIQKNFGMNINIFVVYSDTQNRDKTYGMVVNIIRQQVSVPRHYTILRQRHLSNRYFNLEVEHFFGINV